MRNKSLTRRTPRFGRSAALQMLAIARAMAVLCALHPIPNQGMRHREDLPRIALTSLGRLAVQQHCLRRPA